jgi:hypothetical protein
LRSPTVVMDARSITGIHSQRATLGNPPRLIAMIDHIDPSSLSRPEPSACASRVIKTPCATTSQSRFDQTSDNCSMIRPPLASTNRQAGLGWPVLGQDCLISRLAASEEAIFCRSEIFDLHGFFGETICRTENRE